MKHLILCLIMSSSLIYGLDSRRLTPAQALDTLIQGNSRFAQDQLTHPDRSIERRLAVSVQQNPYAIIIGCSDSRVSPEVLFDVGIGDLFIIRIAGNVLGPTEQDTLNFAIHYLNSSLIVVLGHENCGAIKAVLAGDISQIGTIAKLVDPAIPNKKVTLEKAIKDNVSHIVNQLKNNQAIAGLIKNNEIGVVGGYYNFDTAKVELTNGL